MGIMITYHGYSNRMYNAHKNTVHFICGSVLHTPNTVIMGVKAYSGITAVDPVIPFGLSRLS